MKYLYMLIDDYLQLAKSHIQDPKQIFQVDGKWAQGRTLYGGLSASMLFAASREYVEENRPLRSMTTNYVGPLLTKTPFTISVEVVRTGKNVSQIQARAIQNDKSCVVCQFCFGENRSSKVNVINNEQHALQPPQKAKYIPQIPKVTPKFLRYFDLAIAEGGLPFSGKKDSHYYGWMRYKIAPTEITDAHIVGIIDTWPPTILQMLKWPAPASTISWNLEFIHPHRKISPTDWLAYKADTRQAAGGYGHTEATIWDSHGSVIALSRQTVAVFD